MACCDDVKERKAGDEFFDDGLIESRQCPGVKAKQRLHLDAASLTNALVSIEARVKGSCAIR